MTRTTLGRAGLAPLLFVIAPIVAVASPARADDAHDADEAMRHGVQLRRERRDEEALAEFRRAYALAPTPRGRAQIGLAEQALARWTEADVDLRAALGAKDDEWIGRNRGELESALAVVDGHLEKKAEALPVVAPTQTQTRAGTETGTETGTGTGTGTETGTETETGTGTETGAGSSSQRTWGWIALGGAGVSLVSGVVFTVIRQGDVSTFNDASQCPPAHRSTVCASEHDAGVRATWGAGISYALAGALAITGAVLVVTAPKSPVRVGAWVDGRGGGAAVGAAF